MIRRWLVRRLIPAELVELAIARERLAAWERVQLVWFVEQWRESSDRVVSGNVRPFEGVRLHQDTVAALSIAQGRLVAKYTAVRPMPGVIEVGHQDGPHRHVIQLRGVPDGPR